MKRTLDFDLWQFASRFYRLVYAPRADKAIPMTGSDVTKTFKIDFPFVLRRIHLYHKTAAGAESTDEIQVTLRRPSGGIVELDDFIDDIYKKTDITNSKCIISFEDLADGGLVFEPTTIQLILNSTNTDLIKPIIYIKELK